MHLLTADFSVAMEGLGPFEPHPVLAVAVSGGADSMALAILANAWARTRHGSIRALVVDHGLRPTSAGEAQITVARLAHRGIPSRILSLTNLMHGPALAERARIRRYELLTRACREAGILHLLLGHHAADQAETLAMRVLRGTGTHGLAGMAALMETAGVRLLRPLLAVEATRLRSLLTASGIEWIEDPSNRDIRALRPRLRPRLASAGMAVGPAMSAVGRLRSQEEIQTATELARHVTIRPEGFALVSPGRISPAALSNLIRTIGGAPYNPSPDQVHDLAARLGPATVAGVRIMSAGRLADGLLILREEASIMGPVAAELDTFWDRRFRLLGSRQPAAGTTIGKLGDDAAQFRRLSDLPSVILRTLPAARIGNFLAAVPHLGYADSRDAARMTVLFTPSRPAAGPSFAPVW